MHKTKKKTNLVRQKDLRKIKWEKKTFVEDSKEFAKLKSS